MMELYLIRHGQSQNNALADQTARVADPPLTETGLEQAQRLADYLADGRNRDPWVDPSTGYSVADEGRTWGITHLYCSAMRRALQTAYPVARAVGIKAQVWLEVHEHGGIYLERNGAYIGFGGLPRPAIEQEFPDILLPDDVTEDGWWDTQIGHEPPARAYGRAIAVAQELRRRAAHEDKDARIILITHGTFMDSLLKALFLQLPSRHMFYLHYNTAITRIDFLERDRLLLRFLNRTAHLPARLVT